METHPDVLHAGAALPWYFKLLGALGVLGFFWKMVQSNVPKILDALLPVALRLTDAFVALVFPTLPNRHFDRVTAFREIVMLRGMIRIVHQRVSRLDFCRRVVG